LIGGEASLVEPGVLRGGQRAQELIQVFQGLDHTSATGELAVDLALQPSTMPLTLAVLPGALRVYHMLENAHVLKTALKEASEFVAGVTEYKLRSSIVSDPCRQEETPCHL